MIIKKIFDANFDDEIHNSFVKYSRGEFKNKFLVDIKKQTNKWSIKAGAEFANAIVKACLRKLNGPTKISGVIVTTLDIKDKIEFPIVKVGNFQGVKKVQINTELTAEQIIPLMEKYPRAFFALTFKGNDFDLKIKPKGPTSAKPGKGDAEAKADFCTLKTVDVEILNEFLFDISEKNYKEINLNHKVKIDSIVYPKDIANMKPAEIREKSKRKGTIIRNITIDGNKQIKETEFIA